MLAEEGYSADLVDQGLKNGQLPESRLIEVGGCLLERDAGYTMSLMIEAAGRDDIDLRPAWCYRTVEQQLAAYNRNCPVIEHFTPMVNPANGEPLVDDYGDQLFEVETTRECSLPTASPSKSNHGWGRAVDFEVRNRVMACGDIAFRWLSDNAHRYGWVLPDWAQCGEELEEPWHWEFGGLELLTAAAKPPVPIPPNAE
jgi:LAS superfamily LD-carboxypeptidase LdcB